MLFHVYFSSLSNEADKSVLDLQYQLHEKDMKLTDIRLEALSSAHQLEQLRETMNKMKVSTIVVVYTCMSCCNFQMTKQFAYSRGATHKIL